MSQNSIFPNQVVRDAPGSHYVIVYFTCSKIFGIVLRSWMTAEDRTWYIVDKKARVALAKRTQPDDASKDWTLYPVNIYLRKEGDTFHPIIVPTFKEANDLSAQIVNKNAPFLVISDADADNQSQDKENDDPEENDEQMEEQTKHRSAAAPLVCNIS